MSKNIKNLNPHEKELVLTTLYESAKTFKGKQSVQSFIDGLLTESEKITVGRRILIAQMILSGCTQSEIRSKLNVSPNTFTRTKKWLRGQIPEYNVALEEYRERTSNDHKEKPRQHYDSLTFRGMRKKYPLHFLFFNIADELLEKFNR